MIAIFSKLVHVPKSPPKPVIWQTGKRAAVNPSVVFETIVQEGRAPSIADFDLTPLLAVQLISSHFLNWPAFRFPDHVESSEGSTNHAQKVRFQAHLFQGVLTVSIDSLSL